MVYGMILNMLIALVFLFGLAVGSFLNVVIYRTLHGESPFVGRSKCPGCKKTIRALDNIPLVSYILLRGKCRYCKRVISLRYPVVEFLTGVLFVWWFIAGSLFFRLTQFPFIHLQPIIWLVIGLLLLSLFFTDLYYGVLPDVLVFLLVGVSLVYRLVLTLSGVMQPRDFWLYIGSSIGALLFFLLLILVTRGRGMGLGDAKIAMALGLILGWPSIAVALFVSFISGALVALALLIVGKKKFGQTIPFGPFLIFGTFVALIWGDKLWSTYLALIL